MDAEIYSSSLFVLSSIAAIRNQFFCVFDQLTGEESGALYEFTSAYGLNYEFLVFSGVSHLYPVQVLVRIYKQINKFKLNFIIKNKFNFFSI